MNIPHALSLKYILVWFLYRKYAYKEKLLLWNKNGNMKETVFLI
jgi:hypothetical protein